MTEARLIDTGRIVLNIVEQGTGPLVVLLHGFPETSYSWRHLVPALAAQGFRAVAPDQRGYGLSDRPSFVDDYSIGQLADDIAALVNALGEEKAILVGHDWGAVVAWHVALAHPEKVVGVAALTVPFVGHGSVPPLSAVRAVFGDGFYQIYFQQEAADRELEADYVRTFTSILYGLSGDAPAVSSLIIPPGKKFLDVCGQSPRVLPGWLSAKDIEHYSRTFAATGFTGPLNWYRNMNSNWEIATSWSRAVVSAPSILLVGDRDPITRFYNIPRLADTMRDHVANLRGIKVIAGAGHWIHQERRDEVGETILDFARKVTVGRL
ncbi:alpha/beta hydrolase [Streptomyces sp. NPDC095817]|uniref:alpha/beta fold hydrolase n=1 Tax=Streptomyces sp. NPDC095817 TaxID=3155082 RepID=UPI00331BE524